MELILIVLLTAAVVWFFQRGRRRGAVEDEATLARAWRVVLDDPNYKQRRDVEERRRALEDGSR